MAPLNITVHDFLVLIKEAMGVTIIPSPTIKHSMMELLDKINGTSPPGGWGQANGSLPTTNAAHAEVAAATTLLAKQLTTAKSAVANTTTYLELRSAIAEQARAIADNAMWSREIAQEALAASHRAQAAAIDAIDIAAANKLQCVAELNAIDKNLAAATKNQFANGAQTLTELAAWDIDCAIKTLNSLRERIACANAMEDRGSIGTQGTTATTRSTSTIFTILTMVMATVTPVSILPGSDFVPTSSMLCVKTELVIRELNAPTSIKDTKMTAINLAAPSIGGRATIVSALKTLLDNRIVMPLQVFHALIINNKQDQRIAKATVEPLLDQAVVRITAAVDVERPANQPTLKGLIQDDVNKMTEELRRRVQSLEAKFGKSNVKKSKAAKIGMGNEKKKKKLGTAVAPSTTTPTTPTSKTPRSSKKKSPAMMKKSRQQQRFQCCQEKIKEQGYHSQVQWEIGEGGYPLHKNSAHGGMES
jgi:hypothetical protein